MKKSCLIILLVLCGLFSIAAHAQTVLPYTFQANTPAKAEEVNANFSKIVADLNALRSAAMSNVTRVVEKEYTISVGFASCSSDEIVVGGGCECAGDHEDGENTGTLFICTPVGKAYVGGCFPYMYNSNLKDCPLIVKVICMKAIGTSTTAMPKTQSTASDPEEEVERLKTHISQMQKLQLKK